MGKDTSCKQQPKQRWCAINIRQNRFYSKNCDYRPRIFYDKTINFSERHKIIKILAPDNRAPKIHEAKLIEVKGKKENSTMIVRDVKTSNNEKDHRRLEQYYKLIRPTVHLKTPLSTTAEYIVLKCRQNILEKDDMLSYKASLNKF